MAIFVGYMSELPPNPLFSAFEKGVITVKSMSAATGFSRSKIHDHSSGKRVPSEEDRRAYAEALKVDPVEFDVLWFGADRVQVLNYQRLSSPVAGFPTDQLIVGGEPYFPIPEWPRLKLAASHWVDLAEVGEIVGSELIQQAMKFRRFRVKIEGSCMTPAWPDGALIEFELLTDDDDFMIGRDYYVQKHDGATFKRVIDLDEEQITIGCIHGERRRWVVPRADILRSAQAVFSLVRPNE